MSGPADEEGLGLENLPRLTFFNETFEYDGRTYPYSQIRHIEFTAVATHHRVNFVPAGTSYEADLYLHLDTGPRLHISQERSFFKIGSKPRAEAVMRAHAIFSEVTYGQRLERYEAEISKKGFCTWGNTQISRNGDVFKEMEFQFNLKTDNIAIRLGPFQIYCDPRAPTIADRLKKMWSGSACLIDISIDRDCFLYIAKKYLGLTWRNETVKEPRRAGINEFEEALLVLGAALCKADGRVSSDEIVTFKTYFGIDESSHPGAAQIFREAVTSTDDPLQYARKIRRLFATDQRPLEYVLIGLIQIALANGSFDDVEAEFIRRVGRSFRFSPSEMDRLFQMFGAEQSTRDDRRRSTRGASTISEHLIVLGLTEGATIVEIKAAYRTLARQHHPDLLRAKGIPADKLKAAEDMLRKINASYEWLMKNHQPVG